MAMPLFATYQEPLAIAIRAAKVEDCHAIKELLITVFSQTYNYTTDEQIKKLTESIGSEIHELAVALTTEDKKKIYLIAEHNNKIIGYWFCIFIDIPGEIYLERLTIHKNF